MRFVLNTRADTAGAQASIHGLAARLRVAGVEATVGDWGGYEHYDVAIFMGYDHALEEARAANPKLLVGLADPKQSRPEWIAAARAADFLLVSSIEQREAFFRLNRNAFVLLMFPLVDPVEKLHAVHEEIVLGYHGNRAHLEAMAGTVTPAIEELARRRPVRFVCITNTERHGLPGAGLPDPALVAIEHVQFETGTDGVVAPSFASALARADIGLVPNLMPVLGHRQALRSTAAANPWLNYEPFDWLVRFKASSNPGRLYPFAQLGVPVVADFTPSLAQFVDDGVTGCLAATAEGWLDALQRLADSSGLRTALAAGLRRRLDDAVARQVPDLLAFLKTLPRGEPWVPPGRASAEDDLASLDDYASTARPGLVERIRAKLRG